MQMSQLNAILRVGLEQQASDVHLSPGLPPLFRVCGELVQSSEMSVLETTHIVAMIDAIQTVDWETIGELDFAYSMPNLAHFRVNIFRQARGIAAVFRIIPEHIPKLAGLNLPAICGDLLSLQNGLILVTGPTGSGKSTTLASMLNEINQQHARHIITLEDPIEFKHLSQKSLIQQRQIGRDSADFTEALRAALREDPDIIMIGEMRDLETIRLALTAAETGHLIFATLHTASAARTIHRIVDAFPGGEKNMIRHLLADSLQAVICQTLVPTRQSGRVAACEVMLATPAIRNLIREDKIAQIYSAIQTGKAHGMCTLEQSLTHLISQRVISSEKAAYLT